MASSILTITAPKKGDASSLTAAQKAFNQFNKRIKALHEEQKAMLSGLDTLLLLYHEKIKPVESQLLTLLIERIKIAYQYYSDVKKFSKKQRVVFKAWILEEIKRLGEPSTIDAEIKEIFKALRGIDYDENVANEFELMKKDLVQRCKAMGLKVDFSTIDHKGSNEEIMAALHELIRKASQEKQDFFKEQKKEKKKTKKQFEKEAKNQVAEAMQFQSINTTYKRLVKMLHPDLEQDTNERTKKEALMKKLTVAYESKDLFEILNIELEWIETSMESPTQQQLQNDAQIKIYNSVLKEQVKELETLNGALPFHPRYAALHPFYSSDVYSAFIVEHNFNALHQDVANLNVEITQLQKSNAAAIFKDIIASFQDEMIFRAYVDEVIHGDE
jgi:uncharacterized protein (UPF0335 family)